METLFLVCFLFGGLFTVVSAVLGFAGGHAGHGHLSGHPLHLPHGGDLGHGHLPHDLTVAHGDQALLTPAAHGGGHDAVVALRASLPLLNVSSALAFLTWFGAAGYLLLHFAGWPWLPTLPVAAAAGGSGSLLIALFLRKVMEGERVMDPRAYEKVGTVARVTVTIPAGGVGEIVFIREGTRQSQAARSRAGTAIPRETEVVVTEDAHGVAAVEPWDEFVGRTGSRRPT